MGEIWSKMYIGIDVKCPLFLSDFNETWISRQMFEKASNIKFHENPSNGSRVVPCGWTDRHDKANSRFRNFANAPKKKKLKYSTHFGTFLIPSLT
jgi:hypothetical protein